ncbi:MAG: FG-GAP repeat protein [Lentisphaerae bacterium]|nr:FG-GAP repeat protein [Lentisphaerota bacterium]
MQTLLGSRRWAACACVFLLALNFAQAADPLVSKVRVDDAQARYPATIDQFLQQAKLTALAGAASNYFGFSVALSSDGDTAIVGANNGGLWPQVELGAAYVFTRSGAAWTQQAKLTTSNNAADDDFGSSVTLSGDGNTAIVGASLADVAGNPQGAAYVFTRSGASWSQQEKLIASDGVASDKFGSSVALSRDGNTAIAGASGAAGWGTNGSQAYQGAAYVFTRSGAAWTQQEKLIAEDGAAWDSFGASVALSSDGNTTIVGANKELGGGSHKLGAAYVFTRSGSAWSEQAKLIASVDSLIDLFGNSVTLSSDGNTAIVGAPSAMTSVKNQGGAAWVFTRSGAAWSEQAKLFPSDNGWGDKFGCSVMLSSDGNTAIAGASDVYIGSNAYQGAAYVFTRSGADWNEQAKLIASGGAASDYFGYAVALSSNGAIAIAGAYMADVGTNADQGAAYIGMVPSPPTGVAASDDFYVDRVRVSWDAAVSAAGYEVWRGVNSNTSLATNIAIGITGTNYDDMAATAGEPYYYWIKTTNASGTSAFSTHAIGKVLVGPDVRLNGSAGPVTLAPGSELVVTVSMNPTAQYAGYPVDWWVAASAPGGIYFLNASLAWTSESGPVYQGGLFGLQSAVALDTTALPAGTYTFYFGVDTLNGILDPGVVYDSATVTVAP